MAWKTVCLLFLYVSLINAVRLHKLFQFLEGYRSEHGLKGFLHIGKDYAVFLQTPRPHDKFLVYELYESKHLTDISNNKPKMLAVTRVPIDYIKDQLRTYRGELYNTKFVDDTIVPGFRVKSLKEWQLDKAIKMREDMGSIALKPEMTDIFEDKDSPKQNTKD